MNVYYRPAATLVARGWRQGTGVLCCVQGGGGLGELIAGSWRKTPGARRKPPGAGSKPRAAGNKTRGAESKTPVARRKTPGAGSKPRAAGNKTRGAGSKPRELGAKLRNGEQNLESETRETGCKTWEARSREHGPAYMLYSYLNTLSKLV